MIGDLSAPELIDAARLLICDPAKWMQRDYCDGAVGCADSTRWSLEGALMEAANVDQVMLFRGVSEAFAETIVRMANLCEEPPLDPNARDLMNKALGRIAKFNDGPETTYLDVINMLDRVQADLLCKS